MNILFVCSRNKWRSRTAEEIFKNNGVHPIKSAGTENTARIRVSENVLAWADIIYVMEQKHKNRIQEKYNRQEIMDKIEVLDIPDDYRFMDADLIEILKMHLGHLF